MNIEKTLTPVEFVWEVIAGRSPASLPEDPACRKLVVDMLRMHRVFGLWAAESGVLGAGEEGSESEFPAELRALYVRVALHTELTMEAAARVRDALEMAGCASLLFKGAALIHEGLYSDPGARELGDADILVPEEAVESAVSILESIGFRPWVPWEASRTKWLSAFTLTDGTAPEGFDITVDLHWRPPDSSYRSGGPEGALGLWESADHLKGIPGREAHFMLIVEHFVGHLRVTPHLVGIADLVRMCDDRLDSSRLVELAREGGALRMLRTMLAFLRGSLQLRLSQSLIDAVGVPAQVTGRPARIMDRDRLLDPPGGRMEGRISGLVTQSLAFGSPDRFRREIGDVLYPPASWLEHRYGYVTGGRIRRRLEHWRTVTAWLAGRGVSPLSSNQEFEDSRR